MSCHIQAKNQLPLRFEWQTAILYRKQTQSSHCLQKVPVSSNYASLHLQIFNKHLFFFLLLMFLQLFNLHLCWQVQNMTSIPWKSVCGTISLQETNWSLSRRRSVQTNQWQLDDEWKTLRSIRKVYLSNTGEKCKNMKGARERGRGGGLQR